jgi:hypothetical protein
MESILKMKRRKLFASTLLLVANVIGICLYSLRKGMFECKGISTLSEKEVCFKQSEWKEQEELCAVFFLSFCLQLKCVYVYVSVRV